MPPKRPTPAQVNEPKTTNREDALPQLPALPSLERIQHELASATTLDDFFGKDGIFARLFATTVEQMLEAELTAHIGYPPYGDDRPPPHTRSDRMVARHLVGSHGSP